MRIHSLRVAQLRRFLQPVALTELTPGLNLFTGPNESGKSTLVRALRAAFLERHRSRTVRDLAPWADSAAAPEITVHFDADGRHWQLTKRFLRQPRCDLQVEGQRYSGDEAEEQLARLLGYELPSRGASRPEHQGIPGLLWTEQGDGHHIRQPVEYAEDQLKSVLGSSLGEMASSRGDDLMAAITRRRGQLLTPTGRPTSELREIEERCQELAARQAELSRQVGEYREQVDELERLRRRHRQLQAQRPWEQHEEQAHQARQQLAAVATLQQEQQRDQRELTAQHQTLTHIQRRLAALEQQGEELQRRRQELIIAEDRLAGLEARRPGLEQRLETARRHRDHLLSQREQARRSRRLQDLAQQQREREEDLTARRQRLDRARSLAEAQASLRRQLAELPQDPERLRQLQALTRELDELAIRRQALATRLHYELEPGRTLRLGETELRDQGEAELLQPETLHIEGIGQLRILPGGSEVDPLDRQQRASREQHHQLLQELGVASLEEAEERHRRAEQLNQEFRQQQTTLTALAPEGVEVLAGELERLRQRQAQQAAERAELQARAGEDRAETELDADALEVELQRAEEALATATRQEQEAREERIRATQARDAAHREHARLATEQQSPRRREEQAELQRQQQAATTEGQCLEQALARRQQDIDRARPEQLQQDVERLEASAAAARNEAEQCRWDLERLQVTLEARGAEGLEEQAATCQAELDHARRRHHQLQRRARALDLLQQRLEHHRRELTRQLQAPLQRHLSRYLDLLFPGARLLIGEDLVPEQLHRPAQQGSGQDASESGDYEALSHGAREQMGLISRLAYADLLKEAGRPTLIVLDDALVHSDDGRLEQMKRILYDAAQRHQILLFTCQPDKWQGLGTEARGILGLGEG